MMRRLLVATALLVALPALGQWVPLKYGVVVSEADPTGNSCTYGVSPVQFDATSGRFYCCQDDDPDLYGACPAPAGSGDGDMTKATYDADADNVVDDAEALGGTAAASYATDAEVTSVVGTHASDADAHHVPTVDTDTTCLDGGVACLFAASASEGGAATTALALAADPADCTGDQFTKGIDVAGVPTCATVSYSLAAAALALDPADCPAGQYARGINATGQAVGCTAQTVDTNAGTLCAPGEYLDGDGTCQTAGSGGAPTDATYWASSADATLSDEVVVDSLSALNTALGSSIADGAHTTDTNASTECSLTQVLVGNGSCENPYLQSEFDAWDDTGAVDGLTVNTSSLVVRDGYVTADRDGDGLTDYVLCGDRDGDADMDAADVKACQDDITDATGIVDLVEGEFVVDIATDGTGDTGCSNPRDPHICIRSGITLRGQGPGKTVIKLPVYSTGFPMGQAPIIGLDNDGNTDSRATTRSSGVVVENLTIDGTGTCDESYGQTIGLQLWDCTDCVARNIECKNLSQACVHINRGVRTRGYDLVATDVGNFDDDGAATSCQPTSSQPAFYLYTSAGFESRDSGFESVWASDVGGDAINIRVLDWEQRGQPFGEADHDFDTDARTICQVFEPQRTTLASGVWLRARASEGTAAGNVTVTVETNEINSRCVGSTDPFSCCTGSGTGTCTGQPSGTAVGSYTFAAYDSADLNPDSRWLRFDNTDDPPGTLSTGTEYALCVTYANAATTQNVVSLEGDTSAAADTYNTCANCDVWYYNGSTWAQQTDQDLNFAVENGVHINPFVTNAHVRGASGLDGSGAACLNLRAGAIAPKISTLFCEETSAIQLGENEMAFGGVVSGFSTLRTIGTTANGMGFRIGEWWSGVIEGGLIVDTKGPGTPCVQIKDGVRGATLNEVAAEGCGTHGVQVGGFARDIRMTDVTIREVGDTGVNLDGESDADGTSGGHERILFDRGEIFGTGEQCVYVETDTNVTGLRLTNSTFGRCGWNIVEFAGNGTPADIAGFSYSGNFAYDWGAAVSGTSASTTGVEIRCETGCTADAITIDRNMFAGKDEAIYLQDTGGDFGTVVIRDNQSWGTESSSYRTVNFTSGNVIMEGNSGPSGAYGVDEPNIDVTRASFDTGETCHADGTVDHDVCVGRVAANRWGTIYSGDDLETANCFRLPGDVTICAGSGAPAGGCTTGSTYHRTDGGTDTTLYVCESGAWAAL